MVFNDSKKVASNDESMWARYHTRSVLSPAGLLNVAKTSLACRLFAGRILGMSGPVASALELGCGTASTLDVIAGRANARCVGVDRSREAIEIAKARFPRLQLDVGDIFALPYPMKSFDLVYSVGLLEHFTREEQLRLLAIHAELATKYVCLMVPADSVLMNSVLWVNKRVLRRTGTWADEEVFSPELLRKHFPDYAFEASMDRRFGNLIMWFGWKP